MSEELWAALGQIYMGPGKPSLRALAAKIGLSYTTVYRHLLAQPGVVLRERGEMSPRTPPEKKAEILAAAAAEDRPHATRPVSPVRDLVQDALPVA